jgi:hypothetical protein
VIGAEEEEEEEEEREEGRTDYECTVRRMETGRANYCGHKITANI